MKHLSLLFLVGLLNLTSFDLQAQNSVAHNWIEINLEAVRKDFARPTVHARNLFHTSVAMYDAWAAYDSIADTYFLGKGLNGYDCPFDGVPTPIVVENARNEAISFAAYRMIHHRYTGSPGQVNTFLILDTMMTALGYDPNFTSTDYSSGIPAALGNYIAEELIAAALLDGSNEVNGYLNQVYTPVNVDLIIDEAHFIGNPDIDSLNRWQPLGLTLFCDQGGNSFTTTPEFLSPEWGEVTSFSLHDSVKTVRTRDTTTWKLFHDPGAPPRIGLEGNEETDLYRWGMDLVAKWSSHLDPSDTVMWDISPASIGNIPLDSFPDDFAGYHEFYDRENGGDASLGHDLNPATGMPYAPQMVKRGDYSRILAEFWADGPDSETPPGHWFDIYNEISQYPDFTWKWKGEGTEMDHLEYDIKTYLTLGGGLHDAAISAWSVKGYYDYIRPVSAIRAMAELGQSTSDTLPNFHPAGLKLEPGFMELVQLGDTIFDSDTIMVAGPEYVGEIKMMCWLGPLVEDTCISGFAPDYQTEVGHVGWKLALDWWPYQRPTFVTPPFAGYVSGHSTFSRAAAEIMTYTTGDRFFPGGMGTFHCPQNNYLVFEEGPSEDVTLQWATYQDASDQCSLSRIWGGIHPPADDIPGRKMGYEIGNSANTLAQRYFDGGYPNVESIVISDNVLTDADIATSMTIKVKFDRKMDVTSNPTLDFGQDLSATLSNGIPSWISDSTFQMSYEIADNQALVEYAGLSLNDAKNFNGVQQVAFSMDSLLYIDMLNPSLNTLTLDDSDPTFILMDLTFSETMDTSVTPMISFPVEDALGESIITANPFFSDWTDSLNYTARFDINTDVQMHDIDVLFSLAQDSMGNPMEVRDEVDYFSIDNRAPLSLSVTPNATLYSDSEVGIATVQISCLFDEMMDTTIVPVMDFLGEDPLVNSFTPNDASSSWTDSATYLFAFDLADADEALSYITARVTGAVDPFGNTQVFQGLSTYLYIDTENPGITGQEMDITSISDQDVGTGTFNVTATFSESMDISTTPAISFPVEDPGATLNLTGGTWTDSIQYSFHFDVVDEDLDLLDIDILVDAAVDAAGNAVLSQTQADTLDIEMSNPTALISMSDPSLITDNSSSSWSMTVEFNEEMDQTVNPLVEFQNGDPSATMSLISGDWTDAQTYDLEYAITDVDEVHTDLGISITMAQDLAGNLVAPFSNPDFLDIEMENPEVTTVISSVVLIDNSLFGENMFSIDIEFSEVMDMLQSPSLDFPVEDPSSSLMLNTSTSSWTSESSYRFSYDVNEGFIVLPDVDIQISGGTDLVGNPLYVQLSEDLFDIDITSSLDNLDSPVTQLYPNPIQSGQALMIKLSEGAEVTEIALLDALGRRLKNIELAPGMNQQILMDTSDLADGNYLIQVFHRGGASNHQVIIVDELR